MAPRSVNEVGGQLDRELLSPPLKPRGREETCDGRQQLEKRGRHRKEPDRDEGSSNLDSERAKQPARHRFGPCRANGSIG